MSSQASLFPNQAHIPALLRPPLSSGHECAVDIPLTEFIATVVTILFFSGVSLTILGVEKGYHLDVTQNGGITAAVQWLVYLISIPYMFKHRECLFQCAQKQKLVWILVIFTFLSACWSDIPLLTIKSGVLLCFTTAWGIYFGARYTLGDQFRLLAYALGLATVLSYFFAIVLPEYGIMTWEQPGSWEGIYPHRNTLARAMVLAVLVFVFRARIKGASRLSCWLAIVAATMLVLFAQSRTGLIILFLLFILRLVSPVLRWARRRLVFTAILLGAVSVYLLYCLPWMKILDLLGRDITLTGRLPLWIMVIGKALQRPWLGYGYNSFWLANTGEAERIWRVMHWTAPNAHNGFLDLWVSLGLVGLALFLAGYALVFWGAFKTARSSTEFESLWPLAYLVFLFLYNLDETNVLQQNSLTWALYLAVAASMIVGVNRQGSRIASALTLSEENGCNE